ncbi:MAG TPA: transglutaminase-like domain-containing protein, partial [Alkalispirochaeta sp.]|nr:transglutaminase-like domain-containing protein [Alkalispirochaeta sp.]
MSIRSHSWINGALRRGLLLVLVLPVQRYLSGLMPLWLPVALFAVAVLVERVIPKRGRAVISALAIPTVAVLAATVLWVVAGPAGRGGWGEQQFVLARWHLLPAALLAEIAFLWDRWARQRSMGRMLFVPGVTLAVVAIFWSQARFELSLFPHPSWYAVYAVLAALGLLAYQATVAATTGGRGRRVVGGALLVVVLVLTSTLAFRGWQGQAVEAGGGLLRPTAFQFDFADYVSLEPEISLSRDLVFLYREAQAPRDRLLRRYVLSGYSPRRGFYRRDAADEPSPAPPLSVQAATDGILPVDDEVPSVGTPVDQEYYIVNFDPDALIAVNTPQQVTRRGEWSDSSFNSAYRVQSIYPAGDSNVLAEVPWPAELPPSWQEAYLQGAVPEGVAALAREVTAEVDGYYETVSAVRNHLLTQYYYSLSPGEAVAGNQLEHFLFESRKGYCSYFAFSMTLMLRALDIPSRVAVGFFIDPSAAMLEFYPVRGDMAHAWVEVWFEGIGWVEFDPTSQQIAPGEAIATDYQIDRDRLSHLIQEILRAGEDTDDDPRGAGQATTPAGRPLTTVLGRIALAVGLLVPVLWWYRRHRRWRAVRARDPRRAALAVIRRARNVAGGAIDGASLAVTEERARFARTFLQAELLHLESILPRRV